MDDAKLEEIRQQELQQKMAEEQIKARIQNVAALVYASNVDIDAAPADQMALAKRCVDAAFAFAEPIFGVKRIPNPNPPTPAAPPTGEAS